MIGLVIAATLAVPTPSPHTGIAVGGLSTAASVLQSDPVYVAPAEASSIDQLAVEQVVRGIPQLRVAVLPANAVDAAGGDPAAVPSALSAQIGRGGTVLVLVGNDLEAASTNLGPTDVRDALLAARPLLHGNAGARTAAVTAAARLLDVGTGRSLGEASSPAPRSAGNPSGISGLVALAVLVVAGLAAVLVAPRIRRRRRASPPPPPQRIVYLDSFGRVTGVRQDRDPPTAEHGQHGDTEVRPPVETAERSTAAGEEDR